MDYQQITCQATGKTIKADKMYKIRNQENCIENVVSICHNCPYAASNQEPCQNCYGSIVQNAVRQINKDTGRAKMQATNYRNIFLKVGDEYMQMMDADEFLKELEEKEMIIANLNNANWNHGQRISDHLRAYSYPATWKTDCHNCKIRCHKKGELTACEKAKEYALSKGIDPHTATSEALAKLQLPIECICIEQTQKMYYV